MPEADFAQLGANAPLLCAPINADNTGQPQLGQPIDPAQVRADTEVEASAFQLSLDHLVSSYEESLTVEYDPAINADADPKQEMTRLRSLGDTLNQDHRDLGKLHADLKAAHTAYHQLVYVLPKEDRIRVDFTADFNQFMKDHYVSESIKGNKKRQAELNALLKLAAANHRHLRNSLPENRVSFDLESEGDLTDDQSEHQPKAPTGADSSQRTSTVPSGTSSSQQPATDNHSKGPQRTQSQSRPSEHRQPTDANSAEVGDASRPATHGSSEPFVVNPGSPARVLGMFRATFQRQPTKTSPPSSSSPPLRFNADGSSRSTTSGPQKLYDSAVETGADFSAYNNNPFYQNSCVKLPIRPTECVPSGTIKYPAPAPLQFKGITDAPFTGDIRSYPIWRDAFIRLVHAPGRIMQDSDRLLYLKQCLKGSPLDLVSGYPINDWGYQFATSALETHFFDEKKARFTLRQDLQSVRLPGAGYTDLLRFQQDIVRICGNFYQNGEDITQNDWCSDIVMAKLPYTVRHTLTQRKVDKGDDSAWTISQLLEELQRTLHIMKGAALYDGAHQQPSGSKSRNGRFQEGPYGSSSELTGGTYVGTTHEGPAVHICGNFLQAGDDISYKDWCVDIVMTKLPLNVRLALSQRKRDQGDTTPWTISQLLEELQRALDIMSDAYLYEGATHQQPSGSRQRPNRPLTLEHPYGSSSERTGGTYVGATLDAPASRACAFCGARGAHWSSDCTKYVGISERYDRAKELDYCFACLRKDHWRNANACRVTRTCPFCTRGRHHQALCETFATKRRSEGQHPPRSGKKKKKTSNRSTQRGSRPTEDDRQGLTQDRAPSGAGGPVAPGIATPHRTDPGPRQSRGPHGGRVQMHAAATGNEDASRHTNGQVPVQEDFDGAGPYEDLQQPSGSQVADSYAYDGVHAYDFTHLTQTDGQVHPTEDDDKDSVVTHDSDAPTEPEMEERYDFYDPYSQQGFATVGATHSSEQPTHANFLECVMATVFHPTTKKHKRVAVFFDSGSDGTFVRRELAQELGLPNLGDSPLHLDTFGQDKPVRLDAFRPQLGFKRTPAET